MSLPLGQEELNKLKAFITLCSSNPEILNTPQLDFFKSFIEKMGGKIPPGEFKMPTFETSSSANKSPSPEPEEEDSEPESKVELDDDEVTDVYEDNDEPQSMGDANKIPTEEDVDKANELRLQAAEAYSNQDFKGAIDLYTKAIELNPKNALYLAKRGQVYLKLKKPYACIRDCNRALELNSDSAAAYKFRGRAHSLLRIWDLSAKDLRQACTLDYDEETDDWLKEVTPKAQKIEQHKIKQERKKAEKELRKKQERLHKAEEARAKAQENQESNTRGGGSNTGGVPNSGNPFGNLNQFDILSAFNDPEVAAAMKDIIANPANISKYQSNPKIMNLITKIGASMGGVGGAFPGAAPGAGGFPGFGTNNNTNSTPQPDFSDDGLD